MWATRASGKAEYIYILYCWKYFEEAINRRVAPNCFLRTVHLKVIGFFFFLVAIQVAYVQSIKIRDNYR